MRDSWLTGPPRWKVPLVLTTVVLAVFLAGALMDYALVREGESPGLLLIFSDLGVALMVGLLMFQVSRRAQERNRIVEARLRAVAEMNHHIRNALQVIALVTATQEGEHPSVLQIRAAVDRIDWALREVLPRYAELPDSSQELPAAMSGPPYSERR